MLSNIKNSDIAKILIVGKVGAGKSSLINLLLGKRVAEDGYNPDGVTKEVKSHNGGLGGNKDKPIRFFDTAGVGDADIMIG